MPSYQIEFVGGDDGREPLTIHCVDDAQALRWALGVLGGNLGAEVMEGARKVGWVTASGDEWTYPGFVEG
jgi:hypothetical protein